MCRPVKFRLSLSQVKLPQFFFMCVSLQTYKFSSHTSINELCAQSSMCLPRHMTFLQSGVAANISPGWHLLHSSLLVEQRRPSSFTSAAVEWHYSHPASRSCREDGLLATDNEKKADRAGCRGEALHSLHGLHCQGYSAWRALMTCCWPSGDIDGGDVGWGSRLIPTDNYILSLEVRGGGSSWGWVGLIAVVNHFNAEQDSTGLKGGRVK